MKLFNVYSRYPVQPVSAKGSKLFGQDGKEYLDLYGGHGVISVGHSHPHYIQRVSEQLTRIGFYSNSIDMPIQEKLADLLGNVSGYPEHNLFLCNSGAEAIENALKLASFHTGKNKVLAFKGSFHGRTAAALTITYHMKHRATLNKPGFPVEFATLNNPEDTLEKLSSGAYCAIIVEGIQGVGGLDLPSNEFLRFLRKICDEKGILLILDEIQSGYGRSGQFFAHQTAGIQADLVTIAKGMGNGFPIAGVLIHPDIEAKPGLLGTTFGGNHLACAAAIAVLEIMEQENILEKVGKMHTFIKPKLETLDQVKQLKGKGLMLGIEYPFPIHELRSKLLFQKHIFTGDSANPNLLRILPPLTITQEELTALPNALNELVS